MASSIRKSRADTEAPLPFPRPAAGTPSLEDLLKQILVYLETQAPAARREAADGAEQLLDLEVRGRRYTLLARPRDEAPAPLALSPREREIVHLIARGLPNKTIATVLDISQWTVATHVRRIFTKLEVSSRAEMVAKALQEGLLSPDETS